MSIHIEFTDQAREPFQMRDPRTTETAGRVYSYEVLPGGALAVYSRSRTFKGGEAIDSDDELELVYGPTVWFSVAGTQRA